jgi:hypothetical protein
VSIVIIDLYAKTWALERAEKLLIPLATFFLVMILFCQHPVLFIEYTVDVKFL